ncbi:iron-sulfur cluster-binding domain-containing protein [Psychrobacter sp. NZS113]|uniref:flavin reductase family protein n=1 Tax=Psychrobacter sp. NZS113 TaxID=2792045 RepID=UPI0018CEEC37|nr:iron-sulfur cluster-binding domain-containing protein [Psychrobacter sp. NZS113]MBH0095021.1 iron-sulfur cluster-binding domain-containing protein [Psychrobacter sp. NZS113]
MATGYRPEIIQRAFVDFIGSRLHPFWSLTRPKLRLIARQVLNDDLVAVQFEGNHAFKRQALDSDGGWHGGQHINLTVVIDAIYHQRYYSLVGLPKQPFYLQSDIDNSENSENSENKQSQSNIVTIAIKPQGLVSNYLTQQAPLGTIFDSSLPDGDFTLAQAKLDTQGANHLSSTPSSLLFIAGGSGITPMLGLITQALSQSHTVTLLYYSRMPLAETPFLKHWQQLKDSYPNFTYHFIDTEDPDSYLVGTRHLSVESLLALNLPLENTQIFVCGSQALLAGLYDAVQTITSLDMDSLKDKCSLRDNIIFERFGNLSHELAIDDNSHNTDNAKDDIAKQTVYLRGRQRQFDTNTTLLIGAEQAGITLSYGCRQGICQLCRCNKASGVVKNIETGKISSNGYESIQTCINIAMTDVVLDI